MVTRIFTRNDINSIEIDEASPLRRQSDRPDATESFQEAFDSRTLLYDAYFSNLTGKIELLCPPLLNLATRIDSIRLDGVPVRPTTQKPDRLERLQVDAPSQARDLTLGIEFAGEEFCFNITRTNSFFSERRVLLTMFRYEPLEWVADWIKFHIANHGADACLIYCNFVPDDKVARLADRLDSIEDLKSAAIVQWNFPYGPAGAACGPNPWLWCYCKAGMFEHARTRFLYDASFVLNLDVDELAVVENGMSVFSLLENSGAGALIFNEKQITQHDGHKLGAPEERRHCEFVHFYRSSGEATAKTKWVVSPQLTGREGQWLTHGVRNIRRKKATEGCWFAHILPMNMGWKSSSRTKTIARGFVSEHVKRAYERADWIVGDSVFPR